MKPKISSGYLTPQAKKARQPVRNRLSDTEENEAENAGFDQDLFQALMKCPEKKKMILQLLASNKEAINKYKQKERRKSMGSPLNMLKSKTKTTPCESPTALLRRRALEQMNTNPSRSSRSDTPKPISSDASSNTSSPVSFDKILDGVIAYVEIKSRQDEDRSAGAKAVLKSMGAIVREKFGNDVTHVIFKDGSYSTFQKAKLLKVHLVSILWVEFCRKTMQRQSEKQYPAMRSGFDDETMVCSQMQKEYEDIIREEYRKSIVQGTPLPTTRSLIDRRRTLMTPSLTSTFRTADSISSQEVSDGEVAAINGFNHAQNTINDDLIMNDPDCFSEGSGAAMVNGSVVDERVEGRHHDEVHPVLKSMENIECSDMELTHIPSKPISEKLQNLTDMELTNIPEKDQQKTLNMAYSGIIEETPNSLIRNLSKSLFNRRKTICNSFISSDLSTDSRVSSDRSINETSLISSDKSTNVSNLDSFVVPKPKSKESKRLSHSGRTLLESNESFIFGKNKVKSKQNITTDIEKTSSAMSELKLSSEINIVTSEKNEVEISGQKSTSMSSLQVPSQSNIANSASLSDLKLTTGSSNKDLSSNALSKHQNKSVGSSMSVLQVSNENLKATESLMSHLEVPNMDVVLPKNGQCSAELKNINKSRNIGSEVQNVRKTIQAPEFVTVRKRRGSSLASKSSTSDDSEILSPQKSMRKKVGNNNIDEGARNCDTAARKGELKNFTPKKLTYDSNNKSQLLANPTQPSVKEIIVNGEKSPVLPKEHKSSEKKLVVNIERSPLCNLQSEEIKRTTRKRTLAPKQTKPKELFTSTGRKGKQGVQKKNNNKPPLHKGIKTGPDKSSGDSANDAPDNTDSVQSKRRFRKLYNPDDSICIEVDDEKEREQKRNETRKRKSGEVYINPVELTKASDKTPPKEVESTSDTNDVTPPKRSRKEKKTKDTPVPLNSSADEQKELLNEILNRKSPPAAKTPGSEKNKSLFNKTEETISRRKSTRIVKPTYKVRCNEKDDIPCTPANRRSTLEFMSHSQLTSSRKKFKKKVDKTKLPTIVCTKLHKSEVQVFTQIVRKLGKFNIEDEVSDKTTHLIAGEPKRTINMLRAISRGCWVLRYEWVLSSLEEGKWLEEEKYEVTDFSSAVQKCRLERQAFGTKYTMDVFELCPPIYVSLSTNPRCSDLKELITVCKGKVVNVPRMAKIVVGQYLEQENTVCVNETWVLDCITFYRKMPFKHKYLLQSRRISVEV